MKKLIACLVAAVFVFSLGGLAFAEKPETPSSISGAKVVGDEFVKANYSKMKVFDVRKKAEYVEAHIPGAISAPYKEKSGKTPDFDASKDKMKIEKFPTNKSEAIIVYCNGPRCWKSYKTTVLLVRAGYTNVHQYRNNGFPGWKSKGFPIE
jgi:rhodanese-related sulfurtransferase